MWQSIETAPRDGNFIIGFDPIYSGLVCQIWWCDIFEQWESLHNDYPMRQCVDERHYIFQCNPTHWMPLPAPPGQNPNGETSGKTVTQPHVKGQYLV